MPRRQPGVTKYQTKDGRTQWQYVHDLGNDPATGKRRQRRKRGFNTQAEASDALTDARRAIRHGNYVEPTTLRLRNYLLRWVQARATNGLRPNTVTSYRQIITDYINPYIGETELQQLTAQQLDHLYATLLNEGGRRQQGLSHRTVRYTHTVIRAALGDAQRKGLTTRNVADLSDPPTAKSAKAPEPDTWTPEELAQFLTHTFHHKHGPLFHVAALTGLRRGELCGLRWEDVDLQAAELRVVQTITTPDGRPHFGPPKSNKSRRTVSIDPATVERLRDQQARLDDMRNAAGENWTDSRTRLHQRNRRPPPPRQCLPRLLRRSPRSRIPDSLQHPRPPPHPRHPPPRRRHQRQNRRRPPRPPQRRLHPRHLHPRHARPTRRSRGGRCGADC